jgi:hypothetical protein
MASFATDSIKIYNSFVCGTPRKFITANKTIIYFIAMQTYKELIVLKLFNIQKQEIISIEGVHIKPPMPRK